MLASYHKEFVGDGGWGVEILVFFVRGCVCLVVVMMLTSLWVVYVFGVVLHFFCYLFVVISHLGISLMSLGLVILVLFSIGLWLNLGYIRAWPFSKLMMFALPLQLSTT